MPTAQELETKFWKAVDSDRTMMLGLDGVDGGHTRPMTAQIEDGKGPIWFFSSNDSDLVGKLQSARRAFAAFSAFLYWLVKLKDYVIKRRPYRSFLQSQRGSA